MSPLICHFIQCEENTSVHQMSLFINNNIAGPGVRPQELFKFFFCVFMDRDEVEVHKHAKKERGQYPVILTEQSWSIKDLLYDLKHQKMIFDLAGPSEKSRAGSIAPSCPLG